MGVFKFLFYPFWRAHRDVRESTQKFKAALAAARAGVRGAGAQADAQDERAKQEALPADAHERFEVLARKRGFTAKDILEQRDAVHMGKVFALIGVAVMLASAVLTAIFATGLVMLCSVPITLAGCLFFSVQTLRYGLYQAQLEDRKLYSLREFIARDDLFRRLLK